MIGYYDIYIEERNIPLLSRTLFASEAKRASFLERGISLAMRRGQFARY